MSEPLPTPERIQRTYLLLMFGNTLAASFIWGINTIFLLDAGLSNLEAFAANAFFTAGMVLFEVPTGIVADTVGRRASYLLGTVTLSVTTLLYVLLWQMEAPFWEWAVVSLLLGLGFTFFSGAVEAWLVDALTATGFRGELESVFGRGQVAAGAAMLSGSVAGGFVAQQTSLGVPFVLRGVVLVVMFAAAFRLMHDVGFTPERGGRPLAEMRRIASASIDFGWRVPSVKWLMVEALFTGGIGIYAFYALQPYLLELYGDPQAYQVAGLVAAIVAGSQILGGMAAPRIRRLFKRRTSALLTMSAIEHRGAGARGLIENFWVVIALIVVWGAHVRRHASDPADLHQRDDPLEAAGHDPVLRLDDELGRRRLVAARAGSHRRRLRLRPLVPDRRGRQRLRTALPVALAAPGPPGGHRGGGRRRRARARVG